MSIKKTAQQLDNKSNDDIPKDAGFELLFKAKLPMAKYSKSKFPLIPFDLRQCNDNHFDSLTEAIMFIVKHCKRHMQPADKSLVRKYLQLCRVLDMSKCDYIVPKNITNKQYESAFRDAYKELKAIREL